MTTDSLRAAAQRLKAYHDRNAHRSTMVPLHSYVKGIHQSDCGYCAIEAALAVPQEGEKPPVKCPECGKMATIETKHLANCRNKNCATQFWYVERGSVPPESAGEPLVTGEMLRETWKWVWSEERVPDWSEFADALNAKLGVERPSCPYCLRTYKRAAGTRCGFCGKERGSSPQPGAEGKPLSDTEKAFAEITDADLDAAKIRFAAYGKGERGDKQAGDELRKAAPCPFCGLDEMQASFEPVSVAEACASGQSWTVECLKCGARSGEFCSEGAAIEAWNRRAVLDAGRTEGEVEQIPFEERYAAHTGAPTTPISDEAAETIRRLAANRFNHYATLLAEGRSMLSPTIALAERELIRAIAAALPSEKREGVAYVQQLEAALLPFVALNNTALQRIEAEGPHADMITVCLVTQRYKEGSAHGVLEYATEVGHVTVGDLRRAQAAIGSPSLPHTGEAHP